MEASLAPDRDRRAEPAGVIPAYAEGSDGAFGELYRRFYPQVVAYVASRGLDHALAEDIAQDTLMAAAKYFGSYDTNRPMWPWLRRIAGHLLSQRQATADRETPVSDPPESSAATTDDFLEHLHCRTTLRRAMEGLSPRCRDALWLRYGEDLVGRDAAALLGITVNAFDQLVWRAKRMLRDELGRLGAGIGAVVGIPQAIVGFCIRRRRLGAARGAGGYLARFAPVTGIALIGVLPLLIGTAPRQSSDADGATAARTIRSSITTYPPNARLHHVRQADPAAAQRAPAARPGSGTVIRAADGPASANVTIPRNPVRTGDQSNARITVKTPVGTVSVGLDTFGSSGRFVCEVVSCNQ